MKGLLSFALTSIKTAREKLSVLLITCDFPILFEYRQN